MSYSMYIIGVTVGKHRVRLPSFLSYQHRESTQFSDHSRLVDESWVMDERLAERGYWLVESGGHTLRKPMGKPMIGSEAIFNIGSYRPTA